MRIGAVVTCVNYGDILAWTLPSLKSQVERLIVVTSPTDTATRQVCEHFHTRCELTSAFYTTETGQVEITAFNKAAGINHGLQCLLEQTPTEDDWFLHLDADIALAPRSRELLHKADLDPAGLYGVDRVLWRTFEDYLAYVSAPIPQHEQQIYVRADKFTLGTRVSRMEPDGDGYVPIGFFQLWNPAVSGHTVYPVVHQTAARTDMLFALQWPRRQRHLIPEFLVHHLESEPAPGGTNWAGRVTRPFGPAAPAPTAASVVRAAGVPAYTVA